jgi:hypothetical protein
MLQMGGLQSLSLLAAAFSALRAPSDPGFLAASVGFGLFGLSGFLFNTRLRPGELRWGNRWRPLVLNLREVVHLREGELPSFRGYPTAGIVAEMRSGATVPIPTSIHLGKRRRQAWMTMIDRARSSISTP